MRKLVSVVGVVGVLALSNMEAFGSELTSISLTNMKALRLADFPIKDAYSTSGLPDQLLRRFLRIDLNSSVDLRSRASEWAIGGVAEPCNWNGKSWDIPQYSTASVYDKFGPIELPDSTAYGLRIKQSTGHGPYHIYLMLTPLTVPNELEVSEFEIGKIEGNICVYLKFSGPDEFVGKSNVIKLPVAEIRTILGSE